MSHIVKHQGPYNTFVWRVPENSTAEDTVLHVRESEEAIAVNENSIISLFPCGEYELNREKRELVNSTIYFINKGLLATIVWGSGEPIILMDAEYNVELPVRLDGELNVRVADSAMLFAKFKDHFENFDQNQVNRQIRSVLMALLRQHLNGLLAGYKITFLEIQNFINELTRGLRKIVAKELDGYGLETAGFSINRIIVPTDSPSYFQIQKMAEEKKMPKIVPPGVVCPSCGAALPPNVRFCGYCGCKIEAHCTGCGSVLLPEAKFCIKCGKKVE